MDCMRDYELPFITGASIDHTRKKLRVQARFWRESVVYSFVENIRYLPLPNLPYFSLDIFAPDLKEWTKPNSHSLPV